MKNIKSLSASVKQYNGLYARWAKDKTPENTALLREAVADVYEKAGKVELDNT